MNPSRMLRNLLPFLCVVVLSGCATRPAAPQRMIVELEADQIEIVLRADKAPRTVAHLTRLAQQRFYDNLSIIRVEPGHVVQGGDPNRDASGGSGRTVPLEISDLRHLRGAVGLARGEDPDSGDSQFYICLADRPHLDGRFTVFGYVVRGMDVVDRLDPGNGDRGLITDLQSQPRIVRVRIR